MSKTLTLTVTLDADQFEDEGSLAFFMEELVANAAQVHSDGYAFDGKITGITLTEESA